MKSRYFNWMKLLFCIQVSLMGKFCRWVNTKMSLSSIEKDVCSPFISEFGNTKKPTLISLVRYQSILNIASMRHITKIAYSIVRAIAVDVVNFIFRPLSIYIQPSKPMGKIPISKNTYSTVSSRVNSSSNRAYSGILRCSFFPDKYTGLWVVVQEFSQACCGKIGLSHDTGPSLIGQRPTRASNACRLRYFRIDEVGCPA